MLGSGPRGSGFDSRVPDYLVPVAKRIEQPPPKRPMKVRFLPGTPPVYLCYHYPIMENRVILELRNPRDSEETPEAAAQFFAALPYLKSTLWQRLAGTPTPITLEIATINQITYFLIIMPKNVQSYIESQLTASYPKIIISPIRDYIPPQEQLKHPSFGQLVLSAASYFPLKTYKEFQDVDPLATVLGTMAKAQPDDFMLVQYLISPAPSNWQTKGVSATERGMPVIGGEPGETKPHPQKDLIDKKISETAFRTGIKIITDAETKTRAGQLLKNLTGSFGSFTVGEGNSLSLKTPVLRKKQFLNSILSRSLRHTAKGNYLNISELATLYHLPNKTLSKIRNLAWGATLLGEPPENLPISTNLTDAEKREINFLARTEFKNRMQIFGIKRPDRRRHIYIIGKTGTGKSTLIANQVIADMRNDEGLAVIDPHGDLSEILLDYIPSKRINDVVYFDPSDSKRVVRINPLEVIDPKHAELVASGIVAIFHKLYYYSWGPRLEYILRNSLLTLVQKPNSTLLDIPRILTDDRFRQSVVDKMPEDVLKTFWIKEFNQMNPRLRSEAISPILNKVGQFITSPTIHGVISSPQSSINIENIMNNGKILIANLSQGKLGEDNATLLGAMLITRLQLAAMNRINIPESERRDFYLYVDEFQNFATTSFIKILSEARKYRLDLILANQYMAQLHEDLEKAIFGNAGTLISFILGAEDANHMMREFGGIYTEEDLVSLGKFQIVSKLSIDNATSTPFPAITLPLPRSKNQNRPKVLRISRERYAKPVK